MEHSVFEKYLGNKTRVSFVSAFDLSKSDVIVYFTFHSSGLEESENVASNRPKI